MSETWASLPIEEIEKKLNTSAASGLSQKAARARFQKNGENNFFLLPHATLQDCVREVITQPSVVLLLAISVLFLLFDSSAQARLLPTITVLYIAAWIGVRLWTGRIYRITARTLRPQVRTIREGQMFLLDSARLVPGDLIELDQGDTAPCDLRLVSDTELRVLTYLGKDNFSRTLKNPRISRMPNNDICTQTYPYIKKVNNPHRFGHY